jgi:hypothetical protein
MKGPSAARQRRLGHAARRAVRLFNRRQAEARIGLSSAHISSHSWAEVTPDGNYLAVHAGRKQACPVAPTTRGAVHGFSRQSRGRLLKRLAQVDQSASGRALFVTLTYPLSAMTDFTTCKRHLNAWGQRLRRRVAHGAFFWRLELQKNGSPHFHLILLNVPYLAHQWVARTWYEVVGSGNDDHLRAGTETRRVVSFKEAFGYAAKYAAKLPGNDADDTQGRVWGVIGRRHLPIRVVQFRLDGGAEARLTRFIRNMVDSRSRLIAPREHYPKWLILAGPRALGAVLWAQKGGAAAPPPSHS